MNSVQNALIALTDPFTWVLEPSQRIYWGALLSSLLLAWGLTLTGRIPRARWRELGRWSYWWNASTRVDYGLLLINSLIRILLIVPWLFGATSVGALTYAVIGLAGGLPAVLARHPLAGLVAFTVAGFLAEDGSRFLNHYLQHRVPLLWRFHKVHHSATTLTPVTLYRAHPLEIVTGRIRGALAMGLVTGVFLHLGGGQLSGWSILGVDAVGFLMTLLGSNLRHSHIPMGFGPLEAVLISPVMHQVHHSRDPAHYNRNLGTWLTVWDRLCGTLYRPSREEGQNLVFGLGEGEGCDTLGRAYLQPLGLKKGG